MTHPTRTKHCCIVIVCIAIMLGVLLAFSFDRKQSLKFKTIVSAEQVASKRSDDLNLDSRITALCNGAMGSVCTFQIDGHYEFRVKAYVSEPQCFGDDRIVDYVSVTLDGTVVYRRERAAGSANMGKIELYRGMGKWEHMLDKAEKMAGEIKRIEQEARFKSDLAARYGPLPGFKIAE